MCFGFLVHSVGHVLTKTPLTGLPSERSCVAGEDEKTKKKKRPKANRLGTLYGCYGEAWCGVVKTSKSEEKQSGDAATSGIEAGGEVTQRAPSLAGCFFLVGRDRVRAGVRCFELEPCHCRETN